MLTYKITLVDGGSFFTSLPEGDLFEACALIHRYSYVLDEQSRMHPSDYIVGVERLIQ